MKGREHNADGSLLQLMKTEGSPHMPERDRELTQYLEFLQDKVEVEPIQLTASNDTAIT